jgi:hypothetical protein
MSRALAANLSASILIDSVPGFIGLLVRRRIMLAAFEFALSLYRLGSALLQWQSSPGTLLLMEMLLLWLKKSGLGIWGESCYLVDCETGGGNLAGHLPLGNGNTKREMP